MASDLVDLERAVQLLNALTAEAVLCGAPDWFAEAQAKRAARDVKKVEGLHVFDPGVLLHCATTLAGMIREPQPGHDRSHHDRFWALDREFRADLELMATAWTLVATRRRDL